MRTKKKYAHGGVHKWPPDTEAAPASSTSVSMPQLNFLANQLLPAQVGSNIEAEMLRREGVPAVSTQPGRPSKDYVRGANIFNADKRRQEAYDVAVKDLTGKGMSEQTARVMLTSDPKSPFFEDMSGRAESVAPLIDLTPAGDALALAGAAGKALEGKFGEAGVGAGLATAAVFFPGRSPVDARADDMIRVMAARNEAAGAVPQGVSDIIEYVQEAATPGNISFGRTRSSALGGGRRSWTEPVVDLPNNPDRAQGYLREAFTPPGISLSSQPRESGLELGRGLVSSSELNPLNSGQIRTSSMQLRATADMLEVIARQPGNLDGPQADYYEGVIDGIRQGMPSAPNPQLAGSTAARSGGSATSGFTVKPQRQKVAFGDGAFEISGTLDPSAIGDAPDSFGKPFKINNFNLGIKLEMDGVRQADGTIEYDFFLNAKDFDQQPTFKNRVLDLENSGLSMEAAEAAAKREVSQNINNALKKMYSEIPVGHSISTSSYSTDSYPMFLNGIAMGKYKVKPSDAKKMNNFNPMGAKDNLFRRWNLDSLGKENASRLRANQSFNDIAADIRKNSPNASQAQVERDALLMIAKQDRVLRGFEENRDILKIIKEGAVNHINGQIDQTNENAIQSLIRQAIQEAESRGTKISPQQAEIDVLNEFTPLGKAVLEYGKIRVPVPVSTKIRAEEGAFLPFKIKKKKAKGMRIKKGA